MDGKARRLIPLRSGCGFATLDRMGLTHSHITHYERIGIRADLVTKNGRRVRLAGTWAPELSFTILDEKTATEAGIPILTGYVTVSGAWQY